MPKLYLDRFCLGIRGCHLCLGGWGGTLTKNASHLSKFYASPFFHKKKQKTQGSWGLPICFVWLKSPFKISEPYHKSFWEKSNGSGKKERKRKNAVNSGHIVQWQCTQAARTYCYLMLCAQAFLLRACTFYNLGAKVFLSIEMVDLA
jgi:hypothetical protein